MTILGIQIPINSINLTIFFVGSALLLFIFSKLFSTVNISDGKRNISLFNKKKDISDTMQYVEFILEEIRNILIEVFEKEYKLLSLESDIDFHNREIRICNMMFELMQYKTKDQIREIINVDDGKIKIEMLIQNVKGWQSSYLKSNWLPISVKSETFNIAINKDENVKQFLIKSFTKIFQKSRGIKCDD